MLEYKVSGSSTAHLEAHFSSDSYSYPFGISPESKDAQTSPAELMLGAFSACVLKNVERFSGILKFEYSSAHIDVSGVRSSKPPVIESINYVLKIESSDPKLNPELLMKNIKKFGTIYNTLAKSVEISGSIQVSS